MRLSVPPARLFSSSHYLASARSVHISHPRPASTPADAQRAQRLSELRRKFSQPAPTPAMSFQPLYKYVDRDTLAETVRKHAADPAQREVAIVDVRDDDFEGGNIKGARNHPSATFADEVQDLVYGPLKEYKQVIFHCHLSQQRGPKAAGQYAQARQAAEADTEKGKLPEQQVLVLRGGFSEFQDKYKVSCPNTHQPRCKAAS
ncbi:hypothetical protein L1887_49681 [Cichorium endivia]|nr:hypothetical protein L1887_49681 [Cichorium endivia]